MDRNDILNNYTIVSRNSIDEMRYGLDELSRKIKFSVHLTIWLSATFGAR